MGATHLGLAPKPLLANGSGDTPHGQTSHNNHCMVDHVPRRAFSYGDAPIMIQTPKRKRLKLTREQKKLIHAPTKENAGAGWEPVRDASIKDARAWENLKHDDS